MPNMRLDALDEKAVSEQRPPRYRHANRNRRKVGLADDGVTISPAEARAARPYIFGEEE